MAAEKSYVDMMRASRGASPRVAVGVVLDSSPRKAKRKNLANVKTSSKRTRAKSRLRNSQESHIVSVPRRVSKRQRHIKRTASMAKKKTKRNARGHFVKSNPRKRAKKRAAPKKRSAKRRSAKRSSGRSK